MKYKSVSVTKKGGPEVLEIVESDLRVPSAREARIKILAAPVCLPDVEARYGRTPFQPKIPFVPGYAIVGCVDAIGEGVTQFAAGDRVAALTVYGGYAEYIFLREKRIIPVPPTLDPAQVAPLILNYIVAYQALYRSAKVKAGNKVLIIGASGGIGTGILQLGRLAGLTMYGLNETKK